MNGAEATGYVLGEELGRGALGRVVIVESEVGKRFAGKILHESHRADERALSRFAGEAEITRELAHDNVARVFGSREIDGEQVLLMELVEGESLARIIASCGQLPLDRLLAIGAGLASGLSAAHHAGLIHRDLKPDNVLVAAGDVPKIVDFGLARATSFAGIDAGAFAVVGTPDYMAPESIDPLALDARSDLYALGCILFEMTTGHPPYGGGTPFAIIESHREAPVPELEVGENRPPALIELINSLLAKSPADRPQSATAVAERLAAIAGADERLTVTRATPIAITGTCAACGAPAVAEVGVCFGCGEEQASLEAGKWTVFVTGPGETTDKLDTELRATLVDWIEGNSSLGLEVGVLAKSVPRLPFVVARRISERSARGLCASLEQLGLEAETMRGGRFALPSMRKKGWRLGGRIALIGLTSMAYGLHNAIGAILVPILGVGAVATVAAGFQVAGKQATKQGKARTAGLPDVLAEPLARIAGSVPAIREARHRENLRAIVQRALALRDAVPESGREELDRNLGTLLDLALVGAGRIDEIDAELAGRDIRNPSAHDRSLMLERDSWSARLLEITAFLDTLKVRYASLEGDTGDDALGDLRAHIEALEEIESL